MGSLRKKLRYLESSISSERARNVQLTSTLSDTLRELSQRKDTYLLCSAELASTRNALQMHKEDKMSREQMRREARALTICLGAHVQEAQVLTSQLLVLPQPYSTGANAKTQALDWPRVAEQERTQSEFVVLM